MYVDRSTRRWSPYDRIGVVTSVFIGDSVTDCGRDRSDSTSLGDGYVARIAAARPDLDIVNRGVSGDRVRDLRARWQADCLAWEPELVSIYIGINDTWRRYDSDDPTSAEEFEVDYLAILDQLAGLASLRRLVIVEPFVLPVEPGQERWREDLDPKLAVVRKLAKNYAATVVPLDTELTAAAAGAGAAALAADGVHPTARGHQLIAESWQRAVG